MYGFFSLLISDEYDEDEDFQKEEEEKAVRDEIADSIFEDDYRTEALNRHVIVFEIILQGWIFWFLWCTGMYRINFQ